MKKIKIMIVEDEAVVAEDIRNCLMKSGYAEPAIISTGEEAIELLSAAAPALILMDIHLAGELDGIETALLIAKKTDIPVVFLTAYSDPHSLERVKTAEPFGYIVKPFDRNELICVIETALVKHERMKEKMLALEQMHRTLLERVQRGVESDASLSGSPPLAVQRTGIASSKTGAGLEDRPVRDHAPMAKITRPNSFGVVTRRRMIDLLNENRNQPVTWISGPAGSGKTTLIANYLDERKLPCLWYQVDAGDADIATFIYYLGQAAQKAAPRFRKPLPHLTPEYLPGLATFTQRFFEQLYARFKPPFALVFDNYQEAPEQSALHDLITTGLALVPAGMLVFVASRTEPPSAFMRLRANGMMRMIDWEELRFTLEESKRLVRQKAKQKLTDVNIEELHQNTKGWAAGLVLMIDQVESAIPATSTADGTLPQDVFDYFAGEVLGKLDSETRDFLLLASFLPIMTAATAERLTDNEHAEKILFEISRNHFFTELHAGPVYQFHPLFRHFLQTRITESLTREGILHIKKRTAEILGEAGQIEDAADLFIETADWEGLSALIVVRAQAIAAQGRTQTLEKWLRSIPTDYRERIPLLEYWLGICRVSFDPAESQRHFERSFALFKIENDHGGLLLSWSGIMESIFLGWGEFTRADHWIRILEELLSVDPRMPTPEIEAPVATSMIFALTLRQPHHADIAAWADRATMVAGRITNVRLRSFLYVYLELYYLWVGDHAGAEYVIRGVRESAYTPDASPLAQILGRVVEAVYQVRMGEHDLCRKTVKEGLEIAATTGVVIWNSQFFSQGAINALGEGNTAEADEYLGKMESSIRETRRIDACMYHYNRGWSALLKHDLPRAFQHADAAVQFALKAGTPFHEGIARIALAQVLHEQGNERDARSNLDLACVISARMKSSILEFMSLVVEAHFAADKNDESATRQFLRKAMTLGRVHGYANFYWWRSDVMSRLCTEALEMGIETAYVHDLIRKRAIKPTNLASEDWPWPLKIFTLGGFELVMDGEPIKFSGKVQQKPLALLKALIAFGGKDVPEEQFIDVLWPDAEGDLAHRSFEMAVHRLRKLINHDKIVQLQERRLTLDTNMCWVDAWALEDVLNRVDEAWKNDGSSEREPTEAIKQSEKAIELYKGHFLPTDSASPWVLSYRERLRSKFLRAVIKLGAHWEQTTQWERAADVFQKGIELDNHTEEFYQHLMFCHQQLGQRAEAIAVYLRCQMLLSSALGIAPSPRTEELYQTIKNRQ